MDNIVLVLDAMGVIYEAADDVAELLVPFIAQNGGTRNSETVQELYSSASLGEIDAKEFWRGVAVDPDVEDQYLALHRLSDGILTFLDTLPSYISSVWCLSNDVSEWSGKLRHRFALEERIAGFVISADVGIRKPDHGIYEALLMRLGSGAAKTIFVDDQVKNLDAAKKLGFETIHFAPGSSSSDRHVLVTSFKELGRHLVARSSSLG